MDPRQQLLNGSPVPEDGSHRTLNPRTGMQRDYVVLTPEERARGFVKPLRRSYIHTGERICGVVLGVYSNAACGYYGAEARVVCGASPLHGGAHGMEGGWKEWVATSPELARLKQTGYYKGCGGSTTMALPLAETYARDPWFYGGTFCVHCHAHFGLEEFVWEDGEPMDTLKWPTEELQRIAALRKAQESK